MPYDYEGNIPLEEPEEFPEIQEYDPDVCGDPECSECYPVMGTYIRQQENDQWDIPLQPVWNFTTTSSNSEVSFVEASERFNEILNEQDENSVNVPEQEGEDVPEITPEGTPEEMMTIPQIQGFVMMTGSGTAYRAGSRKSLAAMRRNGFVAQIDIWDLNGETAREVYRLFAEFLAEYGFGISSCSNDYFVEHDLQINVPYYFVCVDASQRNARHTPDELFSQPNCSCGAEIEFPSTKCPECESGLYCGVCREFSTGVGNHEIWGNFCDTCGNTCEQCSSVFPNRARQCPECFPRQNCAGCNTVMFVGRDSINEHTFVETPAIAVRRRRGTPTPENPQTRYYCDDCFEGLCYTCGTINESENILEDQGHNCVACVSRTSFEEWSEDDMETEAILIPTIPGRETIRMVGMEIEGANGDQYRGNEAGQMLAEALYREGLSHSHQVNGYHSSSGRQMTIHVERDSSVDWELVIGPMNVADHGEVDRMNRAVKLVRRYINDGQLKLDMRAGMHVHVGADRVPFHNAYNLHKLYMYMEDFLYRFGAAKWPYHRSINRRNSRDQAGKSPIAEGKLHFARTFTGNRYYGLSFDNYFARYFEACGCGARTYGLFDECTCELGKCTFEFRLFNTTANTVKIHAYLAMCQALVAKAIELPEITDRETFPPLDFTQFRLSDMRPAARNKMVREWEQRIVFINEQLPLTPEEKKSIHYCIINSEMGKVVSNADILLSTETEDE